MEICLEIQMTSQNKEKSFSVTIPSERGKRIEALASGGQPNSLRRILYDVLALDRLIYLMSIKKEPPQRLVFFDTSVGHYQVGGRLEYLYDFDKYYYR